MTQGDPYSAKCSPWMCQLQQGMRAASGKDVLSSLNKFSLSTNCVCRALRAGLTGRDVVSSLRKRRLWWNRASRRFQHDDKVHH